MWYLATMDYIVGKYPTKKEALYNIGDCIFKCRRRPYGYSIAIKDENEDNYWHEDAMWLYRNKQYLLQHGFETQLKDFLDAK